MLIFQEVILNLNIIYKIIEFINYFLSKLKVQQFYVYWWEDNYSQQMWVILVQY